MAPSEQWPKFVGHVFGKSQANTCTIWKRPKKRQWACDPRPQFDPLRVLDPNMGLVGPLASLGPT